MTTEQVETRVLPAVLRLLDRGDLKGGVMVKLAKEAGMSLSTLYAIVPSKADLMHLVSEHYVELAQERVAAADVAADPMHRTREIMLEMFRLFGADPDMGLQIIGADPISPRRAHPMAAGLDAHDARGIEIDGIAPLVIFGWIGITLQYCQGHLSFDTAVDFINQLVVTVGHVPATHVGERTLG